MNSYSSLFASLIAAAACGLLVALITMAIQAPIVNEHDREVLDDLADLADSMSGTCYRSLSLAERGMWENDCRRKVSPDDNSSPEMLEIIATCEKLYARYEANPYWDLEDLLCQRDDLRAQLQMSADDKERIGYRWWENNSHLVRGEWLCPNIYDGKPLRLTCADRDATN